jgi:hypothetical protein
MGTSVRNVIFLDRPSSARVRATRLRHPRARIVAVVDPQAPARVFASLLNAGADACLRAGQPLLLPGDPAPPRAA